MCRFRPHHYDLSGTSTGQKKGIFSFAYPTLAQWPGLIEGGVAVFDTGKGEKLSKSKEISTSLAEKWPFAESENVG